MDPVQLSTLGEGRKLWEPFFREKALPTYWLGTGTSLYRSRLLQENRLPNKVEELGPPCPEEASAGRVNRQGRPVFYCSLSRSAAVAEQEPAKGDRLALAHFRVGVPLQVGDICALLDRPGSPWVKFLHQAFLRPVTGSNEREYSLSIAFAELAFESGEVEGLLYPSTVLGDGSLNLAVLPESFQRSVAFQAAEELRFDGGSLCRLGEARQGKEGRLVWKEASGAEE